jgi:outer membrane lipoprotein-sorting protein
MYVFLFFMMLSISSFGAELPPKADFNKDPRLSTVQNYFNGIKSLKASFLQTSNQDNMMSGTLYIQKPGKMRADYGATSPLLIISDGTWMVNYDKEMKQAGHISLSSSPAELMLREHFSFEGSDVKNIEETASLLKISMTKIDAMEAGTITFIFSKSPFELAEWVAVDGRGNVVRVRLTNIEKGGNFSDALFTVPKNETFGGGN